MCGPLTPYGPPFVHVLHPVNEIVPVLENRQWGPQRLAMTKAVP